MVQVVEALNKAQKETKPPLSELFTDVYHEMPWNLHEQRDEAFAHAMRYPDSMHGVPLE
jgi:2-oxoisovalerate dehydrogenase E1 component alpha subunit